MRDVNQIACNSSLDSSSKDERYKEYDPKNLQQLKQRLGVNKQNRVSATILPTTDHRQTQRTASHLNLAIQSTTEMPHSQADMQTPDIGIQTAYRSRSHQNRDSIFQRSQLNNEASQGNLQVGMVHLQESQNSWNR